MNFATGSAVTTPAPRSLAGRAKFLREIDFSGLLTCAAAALAWTYLIRHLSVAWTISPHYRFGWVTPPLALYFLLSRWGLRGPDAAPGPNRGAIAAATVCALLLPPVWLVRVATPDWSVIGYMLAALVTLWTWFLLAWRGGWRFAAHLAFSVFFIFCAVPWPQRLELWITQSLSGWVAACTVEMLQWAGIAAERAGNVVALPGGLIEVSDACSGVRSVQSMLMAGLCLGEVRRLCFSRRVAVVAIGLALALILNVVRNFTLALIADSRGLEAIHAWHDPAGWSILLIALISLWAISRVLFPDGVEEPATAPRLRRLPAWAAAAFAAWFAFGLAGTEAWYRLHEQNIAPAPRLAVTWPREKPGFRFEEISDTALNLLMAGEVRAASWEESPGRRWTLTEVRWAPGETATQSARMHFPEVCMPATGSVLVGAAREALIPIPGGTLPFRVSEFLTRGRKVFVFFCLREESNRDRGAAGLLEDWSPRSRIERVWTGQRNLGQQSIALAVTGAEDEGDAVRQAGARMPALVALVAPQLPSAPGH